MMERNDYGMYSGGYIFDRMDRAALEYIRKEMGLGEDVVLVTQAVDGLRFRRQLCDDDVEIRCFDFHRIELFSILYWCKVEVLDDEGMIVASGDFVFTEATNHCKIG